MSRTRIIHGKCTKIIGENYNVFAEGSILYNANCETRDNGLEKGVHYGDYEKFEEDISEDFELKFSLKKDKTYSTVVPFGILDFNGNYENASFVFDYSLMLGNVDSVEFKILNEDGTTIYAITNLPEVVISSKKIPLLMEDIINKKPRYDPLNPHKTWDWKSVFDPYKITAGDYTKIGSYVIFWDGFDNNGIFDSKNFNNKKLKAVITATKKGVKKTKEVEFTTQYKEVDWVDVKIDKNNKKIDTTLRVNLKDGGANGIDCIERDIDPEPKFKVAVTSCPWDKIPTSSITPSQPVIKSRTRNFQDLEKLAINGINYHWGRNKNHIIAKDVKIVGEPYEVYVDSINTEENSMDDVSLIYNTNGSWMRSGNPGTATLNPISWVGNLVSREAVCYNVGYIKYSNGWGYVIEKDEDINFKETSAHEIGHEILKSYGGTVYSYGHKGSVNVVTQSNSDQSTNYPISGEIDIMPYYKNYIPINDRKRMVAAESDVLSLIWLTKIIIK
ncbi:hypothetical protein [Chryseobacterium oryctis]|uniref:Uncharacterized protein n=1 Tax=Chryseobacterium oryctis TaxID=2952618 RepID=A0ABT3HNQ5_9FLAO|nr:hypothetical protein [Chryseobacterium oryctis]MCW3161418.1 hypothetical protein [Chryseobacterium oryctis]